MPGILSLRLTQRNRRPGPRPSVPPATLAISVTKWEAVDALPPFPKKKIARSSEQDRHDPFDPREQKRRREDRLRFLDVGPKIRFQAREFAHRPTNRIREPSGVIRTGNRVIGDRAAAI